MAEKTVILCPGQGAQTVGMGRSWFKASPDAARTFGAADELMGDRLGARLSEICFEGPAELLTRTSVAQPALFVCAVASYQALMGDRDPMDFAAVAGLSLGEYTALHLAGAMTFEDGLELVRLRGQAMQDAAEASEGGMVALIGADEEQAQAVCDAALANLGDDSAVLVCANFNAPGQIVISGDAKACVAAEAVAGEHGVRATPLTVAGAFHSPLMAPAAARLRAALDKVTLHEPKCPVLSNVTGVAHGDDPEAIKGLLVRQLTEGVRWAQNCSWILEAIPDGTFHELAPGKTLAGLMRRIDRGTKVVTHDEP